MAIFEVRPSDERTFVLDGELDMGSVSVLLGATKDAPPGDLVLDVSRLRFIDSTGLRAILELARARDNGSAIVLRRPTKHVERVFEIALPGGLDGLRFELDGRADG
jgi:anti-anti-sigma factor